MNGPTNPPATNPASPRSRAEWLAIGKRVAIWGVFLALLHITRDFFFVGFMTFLFTYLALHAIDALMKATSRNQERPWLRRLITIVVFMLAPLALLLAGSFIGPKLFFQTRQLVDWLSRVGVETASTQFLESYVGPYAFRQHYHGSDDPKYLADFEAFRATGIRHMKAYHEFPQLEAWIEGGFSDRYAEMERNRLRSQFEAEGSSSADFSKWFVDKKFKDLKLLAGQSTTELTKSPWTSVIRAAGHAKPEEVLTMVRRDPTALMLLREEWINDAIANSLELAKQSPNYNEQLRLVFDQHRSRRPDLIAFDFDQYRQLQKIRSQGPVAFGQALHSMLHDPKNDDLSSLRADFEAAKQHELFQHWMVANPVARFLRVQAGDRLAGIVGRFLPPLLTALINVPIDIGTALLLSLFICIDYPNLCRAFRRLRETWLREIYDEIVPALTKLGTLVGRALLAQGVISFCDAVLVFVALSVVGVEHEVLLSVATFVLCMVPTLGALMAMVLIATVALFQYGGGFGLALKAAGCVAVVFMIEGFLLSPRILGKMMELHPVMIIAILPIAQYFFGIWGLILATPVAVFVINVVVFDRSIPGEASPPVLEQSG